MPIPEYVARLESRFICKHLGYNVKSRLFDGAGSTSVQVYNLLNVVIDLFTRTI
jgi:hypothetical protein